MSHPEAAARRYVGAPTYGAQRREGQAPPGAGGADARVQTHLAGRVRGSIGHEVSQPLTVILIDSKACLRWMGMPAPPIDEIRSAVLEIATAGNRAKELMRRNRELFQHRTVENLLPDVDSVVRDAADISQASLQHSQIAFERRSTKVCRLSPAMRSCNSGQAPD